MGVAVGDDAFDHRTMTVAMLSSVSSSVYALWSAFLEQFFQRIGLKGKEGTLLLLGLDNAGKSTLVHRLRSGTIRNYPPTDRPSLSEKFTYKGITFRAWDLGGHEAVRHLWGDYACECKALFFLVDAADVERLEESGYELDNLVAEGVLEGLPIAVLLNKCDLTDAASSSQVCEKIQFEDLVDMHGQDMIKVFRISVLRGEGYEEAFQWVASFL